MSFLTFCCTIVLNEYSRMIIKLLNYIKSIYSKFMSGLYYIYMYMYACTLCMYICDNVQLSVT